MHSEGGSSTTGAHLLSSARESSYAGMVSSGAMSGHARGALKAHQAVNTPTTPNENNQSASQLNSSENGSLQSHGSVAGTQSSTTEQSIIKLLDFLNQQQQQPKREVQASCAEANGEIRASHPVETTSNSALLHQLTTPSQRQPPSSQRPSNGNLSVQQQCQQLLLPLIQVLDGIREI